MTKSIQFDFPDILNDVIDSFARGFGLNTSSAALLLLQMSGAVIGPSVETRSPDMLDMTPAFDVALIGDGRAMLPGAVLNAFSGAHGVIMEAAGAQENVDRRFLADKRQELQSVNMDLARKIASAEEAIANPRPPDRGRGILERLSADLHWDSDKAKLANEVQQWRNDLERNQQRLAEVVLLLLPSVIRKDCNWREFVEAGRHSFDGHFIQVAEAATLISEAGSKSNQLRACAELLQCSRSDSAIGAFNLTDNHYRASLHLFGTAEDFSSLMRHPRIKAFGMLNSLVYCMADGDQAPAPDAFEVFQKSQWHQFIRRQFLLRTRGSRSYLSLDNEATKTYFEFREWCWEFNSGLPAQRRVHFLRWPELMIRIATSLSASAEDAEDGFLSPRYLESAAAFLKDYAGQQVATLERLLDCRPDTTRLDEKVEKLVQRLRVKGPQTTRQLARSIHGQDYNVIDAGMVEAIRRGLVVWGNGRYHLADVNVNASTEPGTTKNGGTVAA